MSGADRTESASINRFHQTRSAQWRAEATDLATLIRIARREFDDPHHRAIRLVVATLLADGEPVDNVTIAAELDRHGFFDWRKAHEERAYIALLCGELQGGPG